MNIFSKVITIRSIGIVWQMRYLCKVKRLKKETSERKKLPNWEVLS
jgi:hypothetical protein